MGVSFPLLSRLPKRVGIAVVQEARIEQVLESLRDLTSPRALIARRSGPAPGIVAASAASTMADAIGFISRRISGIL